MTDTKTPSPSDAELDEFLDSPGNMNWVLADKRERFRLFARAVLARWGQPQAVEGGELVACTYGDNGYACCEGGPCQAELHNEKIAAPPPQAVREPLTESEMGEGWRAFQERLEDLMAADPGGLRNMGREHWLSWAHWKAACQFAHGITKGGQHGAE